MPNTDIEHRVRVDTRQRLTADDELVYRKLAAREHAQPGDEPHLERLRDHHLIEDDPHSPRTPLTLDPRQAERQTIQEAHSRIIDELARLRQLSESYERLGVTYDQAQSFEGGVRLLADREEANAAIGRAMSRLNTALYTAQPQQRTPDVLEASKVRDGNLLRRGVKMFTIYPQSARTREPERQWAEYMSTRGAEIRTSPVPFPRIILVDGIAAFVEEPPEDRNAGAEPQESRPAIEITNPSAVAWVRSIYMFWWGLSQTWRGERLREVSGGSLTTHRERTILRLLENEVARSKIARDLDVSQRTISNELQSLRMKFGVDTDFALALRWRDHPEYSLP